MRPDPTGASKARTRKKRTYSPAQKAHRREWERWYLRKPEVRGRTLQRKREWMRGYYLRNRERIRQRVREYDQRNREEVRAKKRARYQRNKARELARPRQYGDKNRQRVSVQKAAYYRRNRERIFRYQDNYRRAHPDKRRHYAQNRRARKNGSPGKFTPEEFSALVLAYGGHCAYCGASGPLTADHRIPLSRTELRPTNDIQNILPACHPCNSSKRNKTEDEFRAWRTAMGERRRVRRLRK